MERFRLKIGALGSALLACAAGAPAAHAGSYLRINQVGYESGELGRAYVMTSSAISGASYQVFNSSGASVASGSLGASTGKWGIYLVYPIDFTISGAGTYRISVSGAVSTRSARFTIDTPERLYGKALSNTLNFYQTERDGANFIANTLRSEAAHLNDKTAMIYKTAPDNGNKYTANFLATGDTMDASGGYFDAGDYLKFVETHSYTVGIMLTGIRDFPDQMGTGSTESNFTNEAEFGLQWLLKMWNDQTQTLYYQVGIGIDFTTSKVLSDHDFWRLPQADDNATPTSAPGFAGVTQAQLQYITHRPVFVAGAAGSKISPNLAGRLAADFALCFQVFHTSNSALADQCLLAGEHVFALANTTPSGKLLTTSPYGFYPETVWQDDMEWGATELSLALRLGGLPANLEQTSPSYYLTEAANWAKAYIARGSFDSLNLYDVAGLAHFDLYRAIDVEGGTSLAVSPSTLLSSLNRLLRANAPKTDPFDGLFTWKVGDSGSHVAGLSTMASEIGYLSNSAVDVTIARRQTSAMFGANGWGVSQIIGDGSVFPDCPQHQPANLIGSHRGTSPVLAGAVVEGPNGSGSSGKLTAMLGCGGKANYSEFNANGAVYWDWVESYSTNEPAIDLTASSMLMLGWRIAGAPAPL